MDYVSVLTDLETDAVRLDRTWGSDLRVTLDDRTFKEAENSEMFVRHSVIFGDGEITSLGAQCFRYPGVQYLSIFYRGGRGNIDVWSVAQAIVRYYNAPRVIGLAKFLACSTRKLPQDAKGFSQLQVVCPFYFDSRS